MIAKHLWNCSGKFCLLPEQVTINNMKYKRFHMGVSLGDFFELLEIEFKRPISEINFIHHLLKIYESKMDPIPTCVSFTMDPIISAPQSNPGGHPTKPTDVVKTAFQPINDCLMEPSHKRTRLCSQVFPSSIFSLHYQPKSIDCENLHRRRSA